ncbi:hypothetical protein JJE66_16185 [Bradyrhizobium diazoefficiens]|uniref:hypothetical protein n=1 Tax=Bradyrhizobium diazoefficiens TaxID=1355477 RepID=UPI00190C9743|nr:hypothetical protein [Bradyrhizobium diazoefficiens]
MASETLVSRLASSTECSHARFGTLRSASCFSCRDRLGIKPLYYYPTKQGVLFGSEPKAILANDLAERVMDAHGLRRTLCSVAAPTTQRSAACIRCGQAILSASRVRISSRLATGSSPTMCITMTCLRPFGASENC